MPHEAKSMTTNLRLGLFILTTFGVFCAAVFLVGRQEMHFGANYRIKSVFRNVAGLNEGAEVRVGGMHEGTVRSIKLPQRPDGEIVVSMDLSKDTQSIVRKDSVASIQAEGLLGDKYVEISYGSVDGETLHSGDTIQGKPPLDISDLFAKANGILDTSQQALTNIQGASQNVNSITAKINQGEGTVGKLVNDKTLYKEASAGIASLHEDADALKHNFLLRGFFNDRGYTNPEEIKKHVIAEVPKATPAKTFTIDQKNLFDKPESAKLKNGKLLNEAAQFLQEHKFESAVISVASGMKGDSEKEQVLSEARSYVIRKYMVEHFKLEDSRIRTIGLGKSPTAGADGSVEVLVYGVGGAAVTAEPAPNHGAEPR
jgi:phospholipid/cholesterol/gamma-HCH transport system substrate-binding protein